MDVAGTVRIKVRYEVIGVTRFDAWNGTLAELADEYLREAITTVAYDSQGMSMTVRDYRVGNFKSDGSPVAAFDYESYDDDVVWKGSFRIRATDDGVVFS